LHFAIDDAALLELMFAGKHRESPGLHEAADQAFAVILELIEEGQASALLEPGDPERVALLLFATIHGIAALAAAGIIAPEQVDNLTTSATARFLHGPRIPA
jgi:hypothetical protein